MKTLLKMIAIVALVLGLSGMLTAQTKAGDRTKKNAGANANAAAADKRPAAEDKTASATAAKADEKAKDPLENIRFRNLGPAVGGGRVTVCRRHSRQAERLLRGRGSGRRFHDAGWRSLMEGDL